MKILYGIQLTGNGHITRSIKIITALKSAGFDVDIITSGTNSQLELPFKIKKQFKGLSFFYNKKGGINWLKTLTSVKLKQFLYA
jgi:UDP-N-acetylglucosamine:LPS N-acetylglucosamine transferase